MQTTQPILSIIVISHNQREDLKRCLDSILQMRLDYPFEIIVSDDRSADGTFELAHEYARRSKARIIALQCNSDECHPANNSQRSGYNRCNAYPYAKGKYIAHVDADDYFLPDATVYQQQIEALDKHPECALAMSNCLCVNEGEPIENGHPWILPRQMHNGEVLTEQEFIQGDYFRINQCFIQRRNPAVNPVALYGKRYVDAVITYHHLQFGKVVWVDACDYVYVGHTASVTGQMAKTNHDADIIWCMAIYISALIPRWKHLFLSQPYYAELRRVIALALSHYQLQDKNREGLKDMDVFMYKCFNQNYLSYIDQQRLTAANTIMTIANRTNAPGIFSSLLFKLLIR
ncbi:MAG: glycosyltransferase family 2 protein [Paludibacteraceae bacterium]|nr:glycosyltransferase family 2 protein [Paludibacteraceae bacterium]